MGGNQGTASCGKDGKTMIYGTLGSADTGQEESINQTTWWAIATKDGGEVIRPDAI